MLAEKNVWPPGLSQLSVGMLLMASQDHGRWTLFMSLLE